VMQKFYELDMARQLTRNVNVLSTWLPTSSNSDGIVAVASRSCRAR
jgi:hypothetical protein